MAVRIVPYLWRLADCIHPVVRESDERTYPTRCPSCRKIAAGPTRVETVKNQQRLLRIDLTCRACGHRWQDIVGIANLDDEPSQTSLG